MEYVIAIPYSLDINAAIKLKKHGIPVITPNDITDVSTIALEKIIEISNSNKKLVIQEVGGYLSSHLDTIKSLGSVVGIVEDTAQGHWRYKKYDRQQLPILSIAFSPLKNIEDTLIGDAVIYSLERILREEFTDLIQGKSCLVLGYGKIGKSCSIALKGREAFVSVFDIDPILSLTARVEGYRTGELEDLIKDADIIIGATGKTSLSGSIFEHFKDGAILASASSRDIEFDIKQISKYCKNNSHPLIWDCANKSKNNFFLLNEGLPVNFRDLSILGPYLQLVYGELFYCIQKLARQEELVGMHTLLDSDQRFIAQKFHEHINSKKMKKEKLVI
ncbi:NAD(P)-dependent oxidoreductase [Bacillus sp. SM2101]|uniref:NAD(P)-dependent oxidoreductase n=1 Tax=Bacillus sp. SM2101 TaxID=2805366 RepID=UPI001BDE3E38